MKKLNPVAHFEMPYVDQKRVSKFDASAFGWRKGDNRQASRNTGDRHVGGI